MNKKEDQEMNAQAEKAPEKREKMSSVFTYIGGGLGLGLFAVFGVLKSSFIGGIVGINIAGAIMGLPLESHILSRIIVALGMLMGIMVAGLMFVSAGAVLGWTIGKATDAARSALRKEQLKGSH
jgi:hypothetical protein